jgi:molecular chaperone GrpE
VTEGQDLQVEAISEEEVEALEEQKAEGAVDEQQEDAIDELVVLREELDEAKAKEAEYLDGWQRARAELANARKRFEREQVQAYTNARADVLKHLLPIVDDFERAFETLPANLSGLTWIEGVLLIRRKLDVLLEQSGVTPIDAVGEEFDPFAHQAVTHEPSDTVPPGHVIAELQKGYRISERVLRPSMVRVSSGLPVDAEAEPEPSGEEEPAEEES